MEHLKEEFGLDPDEIAELRLELQEAFLLAESELDKNPTSKELQHCLNLHHYEFMSILNEAFEGYNDLVRSMGEVPKSFRTPQDNADYIFRSNVELPESGEKIKEQGYNDIHNIANNLGSYPGLMESLGIFDEYLEKIECGGNSKHVDIQNALERRSRDRESQIDNLEDELEKYYCEFTAKYETYL